MAATLQIDFFADATRIFTIFIYRILRAWFTVKQNAVNENLERMISFVK